MDFTAVAVVVMAVADIVSPDISYLLDTVLSPKWMKLQWIKLR